ncbi:hypothetical protein Tco_0764894 [Tanacetum coccineum]
MIVTCQWTLHTIHIEVAIQTPMGMILGVGVKRNLTETNGHFNRLVSIILSYMGFQYSVENVMDYLTTTGITAIPGERRSIEELEGMSWHLKPPEQTLVRVPSRVAVNERLNRSTRTLHRIMLTTPQELTYLYDLCFCEEILLKCGMNLEDDTINKLGDPNTTNTIKAFKVMGKMVQHLGIRPSRKWDFLCQYGCTTQTQPIRRNAATGDSTTGMDRIRSNARVTSRPRPMMNYKINNISCERSVISVEDPYHGSTDEQDRDIMTWTGYLSKQGNIARSVVYQELDLDDKWNIVSVDFDDSNVYSISEGECDTHQSISIQGKQMIRDQAKEYYENKTAIQKKEEIWPSKESLLVKDLTDALKIIDHLRIEKKKLEEQKDEEIRELKTQLQKKKKEEKSSFR